MFPMEKTGKKNQKRKRDSSLPTPPHTDYPTMATAPPSNVTLKLLVNKKSKKVLFAEAGEAAVDFLCSILTLPVATVIQLLSELDTVGSLSNLYKSIENLDGDYILPNLHKDTVLNPSVCNSTESTPLFLLTNVTSNTKPEAKKFYRCYSYNSYGCSVSPLVTNVAGTSCPYCQYAMESEVMLLEGSVASGTAVAASGGGGFMKGVVTYMVMDDLEMMPMSTITGITLLNKLNVEDIGGLEERVVHLDMAKGLRLLKASLQSKNVLTEVFLN